MSETRDLRERYWRAYHKALHKFGGHALIVVEGKAAKAVYDDGYAEALQDLINHMTVEPGHVRVYAPDDIRRYAAERGIDLTESEEAS